jgi:3-deoxy-D-manno-octulosonic-acid transferase
MLDLIYNVLITLSWPVLWLYYRLRVGTDGKYRTSFRYRLGLALPGKLPAAQRVWIHALSVGETLSVIPLVQALKTECPALNIVFSSATETGRLIAQQRLARFVTSFFFLPHDFPWAMKALVRQIEPDLFVVVETDIWPNLLRTMKESGIATVLVNGRFSQSSFSRYRRLRPWVKHVFSIFDLVFAQSMEDRDRYLGLGCSRDRVHAMGNLKFDSALGRPTRTRIDEIRKTSGIEEERPVWVVGSSHEGEEEILSRVHKAILEELPGLLLVLAPRRIQRGREIAALCESFGLRAVTRSSGESAVGKDVYVLDTLGELSSFYGLGEAVFIGGSLVPFGGHNPLESVAQEKPTCWGPHLFNFREMERDLINAGCGRMVASEEELRSVVRGWLKDPTLRDQMKRAARGLVESHSGSSRRIARFLLEELACGSSRMIRVED